MASDNDDLNGDDFNCHRIACTTGTYNRLGRRGGTSVGKNDGNIEACLPCPDTNNPFIGQKFCKGVINSQEETIQASFSSHDQEEEVDHSSPFSRVGIIVLAMFMVVCTHCVFCIGRVYCNDEDDDGQ